MVETRFTCVLYIFTGILVLTGVLGCVGGLLLLGLWWRLGLPVLNVLFIGLVLGYLFSSVLFYTPFGKIVYLYMYFFQHMYLDIETGSTVNNFLFQIVIKCWLSALVITKMLV